MTIDELIQKYTLQVLKKNHWYQLGTAKELGISERCLHEWIAKWRKQGIHIPRPLTINQARVLRKMKASMEGTKNLPMDE